MMKLYFPMGGGGQFRQCNKNKKNGFACCTLSYCLTHSTSIIDSHILPTAVSCTAGATTPGQCTHCPKHTHSPDGKVSGVVQQSPQGPLHTLPLHGSHRVKGDGVLGKAEPLMQDQGQPSRFHTLAPVHTNRTDAERDAKAKDTLPPGHWQSDVCGKMLYYVHVQLRKKPVHQDRPQGVLGSCPLLHITKYSLHSVEVCVHVELLKKPVHQDLPISMAVFCGSFLEAVRGVMAAYPQHISHRIPKLRGAVEIQ